MSDLRPRRVDRISQHFGIGAATEVPRLMWFIGLGAFIASTGASFIWPLTTIYIRFVLGKPLVVAGLVLMLQAGSTLAGQLVGGRLFDLFGGKPVIIGGLVSAAAMLAVIGLVRIWPVYLAAMSDLWSPPAVLAAAGAVCMMAAGSYWGYGLVAFRRCPPHSMPVNKDMTWWRCD